MRLRDSEGQALRADHSHVAQQGGHAMRTFDFAPFYRSTVGFDRLFSTLDQLVGMEGQAPSYPPYDIERTGENAYRISLAVAGFPDADLSIEAKGKPLRLPLAFAGFPGADLSIEAKENTLTVRGEKQTKDEETTGDWLYRGIAGRNFERSFQLADHVEVMAASLNNGLLHVDLVGG